MPEPETEAGQPSFDDAMATIRKLQSARLEQFPVTPEGYVGLSNSVKQRLRNLPKKDTAEAQKAAQQIIENAATYREDLGEDAPPLDKIKYLAPEFQTNAQIITRLENLLSFHLDKQMVLANDLVTLLEEINAEVEHRARKRPHLTERYSALGSFFEMRRKAIAEGIARARKPDPEAAT